MVQLGERERRAFERRRGTLILLFSTKRTNLRENLIWRAKKSGRQVKKRKKGTLTLEERLTTNKRYRSGKEGKNPKKISAAMDGGARGKAAFCWVMKGTIKGKRGEKGELS